MFRSVRNLNCCINLCIPKSFLFNSDLFVNDRILRRYVAKVWTFVDSSRTLPNFICVLSLHFLGRPEWWPRGQYAQPAAERHACTNPVPKITRLTVRDRSIRWIDMWTMVKMLGLLESPRTIHSALCRTRHLSSVWEVRILYEVFGSHGSDWDLTRVILYMGNCCLYLQCRYTLKTGAVRSAKTVVSLPNNTESHIRGLILSVFIFIWRLLFQSSLCF
jgi:hypothetical protein